MLYMKYPNVYKGIAKILTSEILEAVISVMMAVFVIYTSTLARDASGSGAVPGVLSFMIVISGIGILSLVLYLVGVVQARKEEHEFQLALIMTIIALAMQITGMAVGFVSPVIAEWIEFGCEIIGLIAFESVVSGVVNIAKKIGDEKVLSIGKKMRILVTFIWIAMISAKGMEFISGDAAEYVKLAHAVLELVDHILYVILLVKGRRMLERVCLI